MLEIVLELIFRNLFCGLLVGVLYFGVFPIILRKIKEKKSIDKK